ncbi:GNAT family N-acetyltransferase [Agarilytica rhodophyticola]|uniref:GNAT family N-acetyltransferase n=1 Tax=Agarilytica rhodophyticola TaxID=1737490 RepID=UPI000B3463A2|nr:GNAT family N-acetyltransferase [Agarilytica rhodophyticola]
MCFVRDKLLFNKRGKNNKSPISYLSSKTLGLLIEISRYLYDWPLVAYCCEVYQDRLCRGSSDERNRRKKIDNLYLLNRAYLKQGLFESSERLLSGEETNLEHPKLQSEYYRLKQIVEDLPPAYNRLRADKIVLTPLASWHKEDFFLQYSDPTISALCRLPNFDYCSNDWLQWLTVCRQNPAEHLLAIYHLDWGFIGSASIEISKGTGFFYYWLGVDFRGQGFGPKAVTVLLDWADTHMDLRSCYTKIHEDNLPSIKATMKSGFEPLPITVFIDDEEGEESLYYRGKHTNINTLCEKINKFFSDTCALERAAVKNSQKIRNNTDNFILPC